MKSNYSEMAGSINQCGSGVMEVPSGGRRSPELAIGNIKNPLPKQRLVECGTCPIGRILGHQEAALNGRIAGYTASDPHRKSDSQKRTAGSFELHDYETLGDYSLAIRFWAALVSNPRRYIRRLHTFPSTKSSGGSRGQRIDISTACKSKLERVADSLSCSTLMPSYGVMGTHKWSSSPWLKSTSQIQTDPMRPYREE